MINKDLGMVTAYAYAVSKGYAGTEEQFATLMASYADVGQTAVDAALAAKASEDAAKASETASAASQAAAATSAGTATTAAQNAAQSATAASGKATEATQAATAAETAKGAAQTAQATAETAAATAITKAAEAAASAAQAAEDAEEISSVKNALGACIITDTASGAIATFTDGSDGVPMESVTVQMEPIQDLHGQDAPYPGGGGKNLVDMNLTSYTNATEFVLKQGTYTVSTKTPITGETWYFSAKKSDNSWCIKTELGLDTFNEASASGSYYGGASNSNITFICPEDNVTFKIGRLNADGTNPLMVEVGSTATTFAPYSNICPISGRSEVRVWRSGVNLLDKTDAFKGGFDSSGVPYANQSDIRYVTKPLPVKGNTTYYLWNTIQLTLGRAGFWYDIEGNPISQIKFYADSDSSGAVTSPSNAVTCRLGYLVANENICMMSVGNTQPTTYEPYTADTITVQLGQTVYGGTVDVVSGVMTVDRAMVDLGTLTWTYESNTKRFETPANSIPIKPVSSSTTVSTMICSQYKTVSGQTQYDELTLDATLSQGTGSSAIIRARDLSYADAASFKAAMNGVQLCYELAQPVSVQLTAQQLTTLLGTNNVWSDGGNVSVEYVADTKAYIAKVIAAALA